VPGPELLTDPRVEWADGLAHVLAEPLVVADHALERLESHLGPDDDAVAQVRGAVDRAQVAVDGMLRLRRALERPVREPVGVEDLVREALRQLRVRRDVPSPIVEVAADGDLHVDPDLAAVAVFELLANVADHGGARVRVTEEAGRVVVADDGPGLDPDLHEAALLPFRRLSEDARRGRSGCGLAVVRTVAEGHGGAVALGESPLGGLAVFLALPPGGA
jgi:two-component system sensor histidine kinase QseC